MPTGVHLHDARQQLFDAAERILVRDGARGLTSRAVTDEAGCAKGVLHRHFSDFDTFLAELILDHAARLERRASALGARIGEGSVAENLSLALSDLLGPVPMAILPLITFHDELRDRLRQARSGGGIAVLSDVSHAVSAYLAAERSGGRIAAAADVDALTLSLVGGAHLLFADRDGRASPVDVERFVAATLKEVAPPGG